MNYDFALITLEDEASAATGTLGLYQPPISGSQSVNITTAGGACGYTANDLCVGDKLVVPLMHVLDHCSGRMPGLLAPVVCQLS